MGLAILSAVVVLSLGSMAVQGWLSHRPVRVGISDGRLRACPNTPNCVSSDAPPDSKHYIEPLTLPRGQGAPLAAVRAAIEATPRTRIVKMTENYLHAEYETLIFRFVDDVELQLRPGNDTVAVRSASRVGHWDLGTNRRRIEQLRRQVSENRAH